VENDGVKNRRAQELKNLLPDRIPSVACSPCDYRMCGIKKVRQYFSGHADRFLADRTAQAVIIAAL